MFLAADFVAFERAGANREVATEAATSPVNLDGYL
jgi:hypothetical protein